MKRILSLLLALVMVFPLAPAPSAQAAQAGLSVALLKEKFPNGSYWNHQVTRDHTTGQCSGSASCNAPDYYTDQPCTDHSG